MTQAPPRIVLKPGREKSLLHRHPWIFSGAIARVEGDPGPGATVCVHADGGAFLARAAFSPASQIAFAVTEFWNRTAPLFYKDAKYAFFITPLSLLPVHLGPWKWLGAPSGKYHFKDRSLEEDEGSPFLMKGRRMFLNDENDFAFGDFHIDSHGTNVNT